MADEQTIAVLKKRRDEIAREIFLLKLNLNHINATIRIFKSDEPNRLPASASIARPILETLRVAGVPMSCKEIAEAINAEIPRVYNALGYQVRHGILRARRDPGQPQRWEVAV